MSLLAAAAGATTKASSSVVISNLAYLVGAIVLAIVVTCLVALYHRRPRSTEQDMDEFHKRLVALDPDRGRKRGRRGSRRAPQPIATRPEPHTNSRPQLRPQRLPGPADGTTPPRPSTRSTSG